MAGGHTIRRGVRYYRALPPPHDEWEPDYAAIADAGFDFVVVPVPWSCGHVFDDAYDFAPLVEQLELAERHKLGIVVAADLTTAPPWLTARHPEYLHQDSAGTKLLPRATADAPCGGWPGLCFDNGTVRAYAGRFLRALAAAAIEHPSLAGYDLSRHWALEDMVSVHDRPLLCQCAGSRARFMAWLRRTYAEDLGALGATWGRRFRQWAEVAPPPDHDCFPDVLDWFHFHRDTLAAQLRWCVEAIREADPSSPVIAAGAPIGTETQADGAALAREVSEWGATFTDTLSPHEAIDRARGIAPGRKLWVAGLPPTPDWASRLREMHWSLLCSGADSVVYAAWRPDLRLGATAQSTLARPDGTPAELRAEADRHRDLLAEHPDLAAARPAPPEVAIVVVPEAQALSNTGHEWWLSTYAQALDGAYRAFAGRGAQPVFVPADGLAACPLAYVPHAMSLDADTANALRQYVEAGGCLVAEACLAIFDEHGIGSRTSPGQGLDEVFGARAADVAEIVVEGAKTTFKGRGAAYPCAARREPLEATTGKVKASFADGTAAIVDHTFGDGATRLIGTCPSLGCANGSDKRHARVILDSLAFAKLRPRVTTSSPDLCVRLLEGDGVHFVCAFNPSDKQLQATVTVSRRVGTFRGTTDLVTGKTRRLHNNARRLKLDPSQGALLRLEAAQPRPRWRRPGRRKP